MDTYCFQSRLILSSDSEEQWAEGQAGAEAQNMPVTVASTCPLTSPSIIIRLAVFLVWSILIINESRVGILNIE